MRIYITDMLLKPRGWSVWPGGRAVQNIKRTHPILKPQEKLYIYVRVFFFFVFLFLSPTFCILYHSSSKLFFFLFFFPLMPDRIATNLFLYYSQVKSTGLSSEKRRERSLGLPLKLFFFGKGWGGVGVPNMGECIWCSSPCLPECFVSSLHIN